MISITKKERNYLVNECGIPCGEEGVYATRKKKYWLTESRYNLPLLNNFRKSIIIESHTK